MNTTESKNSLTPSQHISNQITEFPDWRGVLLARLRRLVLEAAPGISEEWKWETPVWSQKGMVCAVGVFKDHVKLNFFKGASLDDPKGLFNAGLDAKNSRAIDFSAGEEIDEPALKELIQAAVDYNLSDRKKK